MVQRSVSLSLVMLALLPVSAWAQTTGPTPAQPDPTPTPAPTVTTPVEPPPVVTPSPVPETATPTPTAEPVAPELTTAPPPVTPVEPTPEAEPESEFPEKLAVGHIGFFKPGALLQGWAVLEPNDETEFTFRLRRAEIKVQGEIVPERIAYQLMIDPARALETKRAEVGSGDAATEVLAPASSSSSTSIFQDFFITYITDFMDVSLGQFKIPVSYEGYNSSSKLLFAERAPVSRLYGDRRDVGLRLAKTFDHFGYSAGIFNGTGQNNLDANASKDLGLRLEIYPIKGLLIGGVVYASAGDREDPSTKDRYEADLRFESGGFLFQGEFIHGRNGAGDAAVEGNGFYAALAYAFMDGKIQPALRVGYVDPDASGNGTESGNDELLHIDVGLTYYILKQEAKLLLNYYRTQYDDIDAENTLILAAQVSF